ncbi:MAG: PqqD family protein [Intrasporangiaceae bacterium]|nr:PqqD family protein [Intrasporangiaceae bacterium]
MTTYSVPKSLAHGVLEEDTGPRVFLRHVPGGPNLVLESTGALIWCLATEVDDVPAEVAELTGMPVDEIRADVLTFLDSLIEGGLLARRQEQEDAARLVALREAAARGWEDLAAGRYEDVADDDLEDYIGQLGAGARNTSPS